MEYSQKHFTLVLMTDEIYIQRCIDLAKAGKGYVAPNPMVGAVLVHNNRIIGEGFHEQYGQAHAEVNCIQNVREKDKHLIASSTMYVSLEPCAHFGKTPPCTDLLIQQRVKRVVIGTKDIFSKVNGQGIAKLQNAGIEVLTGIGEKECIALNKRFFTFHRHKRPYIILKWAQTNNNIIGVQEGKRLMITNELTNRLVHKWRSEEAAILVGTQTVLKDNPSLTNRLYSGHHPLRLCIDRHLGVPKDFGIVDDTADTVIFNAKEDKTEGTNVYKKIDFKESVINQVLDFCYAQHIQSILVEGGAHLLQSFINEGIWDECRMITNTGLFVEKGVKAPVLKNAAYLYSRYVDGDKVDYYKKKNQ